MSERETIATPVLVIGKGQRPGRISFGPEVVVEGVTAELQILAPALATHVEPRHVGRVLRLLFSRSTRVVHFLSTGRWSLLAPLIRVVLRKEIITTFHGYVPLVTVSGIGARLRHIFNILQVRAGLAGAQSIVSVSSLLARRTMAIAPLGRHRVIPNGLSPQFEQELVREGDAGRRTSGPLRVLIVGVAPHKGIEGVLEALEALDPGPPGHPSWRLTLVGVTPMTRRYLGEVEARFVRCFDRVTVLDALPHASMPAVYRDHDVLLLWSSHEAFGLVVLEAMACGVIPVISDRVGAQDQIVHGVNGFIVPLGDTTSLVRTLRLVQDRTHGIDREALRSTARKCSMRSAAEAYRELYLDLLGPGPRVFFVTNICPHYRVRTFELLAERQPTRFFFFSESRAEKYWEHRNPTELGRFEGTQVPAVKIGRFRFVPRLYQHLLWDRYDLLVKCINGKLPLLLSYIIVRLRGIPFVLWTELWHHPRTFLHRLGYPFTRWIYIHADAIVVGGLHTRAYLECVGVAHERIFLAWQAVDHRVMGAQVGREDLERAGAGLRSEGRKVVLYVGRIEKQKGLEYLAASLRGVAQRVPVTLVVVGEGSWKEDLRRYVERIPRLSTRFLGYTSPARLPVYYRLADVLVLPSITTRDFREPWGLVVNEAMHQGCPVVATTAVGAAMGGLVLDGKTGLVVPERDSAALEEALVRILTDQALRDRYSANALEAMKDWTQERMVLGFASAIGYALSRTKGRRTA